MRGESPNNPPIHVTQYGGNRMVVTNNDNDVDELPDLTPENQKKIVIKSLTRGLVLSIMIAGLYIYQKVIKKHQKGHTPQTFFLLFIAISICNYMMHTFTPEFYTYVISGLGWGVGSVMFKYIIDI